MTSWRESVSQQAQDDLDALVGAVLPFAEQTLSRYGELYPFGAAMTAAGDVVMLAADPDQGERPASQDLLEALYAGARESRAQAKAVAVVSDVTVEGSDAVRVELEHQEGVALTLLLPYARSRFRKKVTFRELTAAAGTRRVWP